MRTSLLLVVLAGCGAVDPGPASGGHDLSAGPSDGQPTADLRSAGDAAFAVGTCTPLTDGCIAGVGFALPAGHSVAGGGVELAMRVDGDLVVYRQSDHHALVSTSTMQRFDTDGFTGATTGLDCDGCAALFGADGALELVRADGSRYWSSGTAGHPSAQLGIRTTSPYLAIVDGGATLFSSLMQSAHVTDLNAQLTGATLPLDYQVQDVCVDGYDHPVAGDPVTCSPRRNLRIGEASPFLRTDVDTVNGNQTYQALVSFPVPAVNGDLLVMTTKTNAGSFGPSFSFTFDQTRDGYDLADFAGDYVSFIRTSDGGCFDQRVDGPTSRLNGWILHPTTYPFPDGPTGDPFNVGGITLTRLVPEAELPAACVNANKKLGFYQPSGSSSSAEAVWNPPVAVTYESGKTLQSVITYHFASNNLASSGNALERYFFTSEYGFTRWESWAPVPHCEQVFGAGSVWCQPASPDYPLRGRCSPSNIPATATWGNQTWVRNDCRDSTNYIAVDAPTLPLDPTMAASHGLVDVDNAAVYSIAMP